MSQNVRIPGKIVKGLGGLYEVRCIDGEKVLRRQCRARGSFRRDEGKLLIGDNVLIGEIENGGFVIEELLPRKNSLIRPPMANLDYLFVVLAACRPEPVLETVDKLTAIAVHNGIVPVIVITKEDLSASEAEKYTFIYKKCGFEVFPISSVTKSGVDKLKKYIDENVVSGMTAAFAGASGVGKSTLINSLFPNLSLSTSEISRKTERGKHTTRHVEMFELTSAVNTGFLADTPGFSLIDFSRFDFFGIDDLFDAFPEFASYRGMCRYSDCAHMREGEDECAVMRAVRDGKIPESRKESYGAIYEKLKNKENFK